MTKTYKVKEIFGPTIQGEGSNSGEVVSFVRLSGCNRWSGREQDKPKSICNFCDTDFLGGEHLTAKQIVEYVSVLSRCGSLVISGGEPLLQLDYELALALKLAGFYLAIETNGSIAINDDLRKLIDHISMSPKQSIEQTKLSSCDDIKILYPYIGEQITIEAFSSFKAKARFVQPVWNANYYSNLMAAKQLVKNSNGEWKLGLQLHKIIEEK